MARKRKSWIIGIQELKVPAWMWESFDDGPEAILSQSPKNLSAKPIEGNQE